jgi:hypothetical protein
MKIRKFNENISKKDSPFTNWEMMEELIAPIFKYDWTVYYKLYTTYDATIAYIGGEEDVMPIGPKHTKNFSDLEFWEKYSKDRTGTTIWPQVKIHGAIIDINDQIFNVLSADEGRMGRKFSTYNSEKLIQILEDIERIKDDCATEGYTLLMFMKNDGFGSMTNFNRDAQISLLILDGVFK